MTLLLSAACRTLIVPETAAIFEMERGECFGTCPVDHLSIYSNRTATYEGKQFTKRQGKFIARIPKSVYDSLKLAFAESGFMEMKDEYTSDMTDFPTITLRFRESGKEKTVIDYYGAPEELKQLERKLAGLINSLEWKKARD